MKPLLFVFLILLATPLFAQGVDAILPVSPRGGEAAGLRSGENFESGDSYVPTPRPRRSGSSFNAYGAFSSFGQGALGTFTSASMKDLRVEYTGGWMNIPGASNIEGRSLTASVIPMFVGTRYDFADVRSGAVRWISYFHAGGGPLAGVEVAPFATFYQFFSRLAFKWGAGAYAGMGTEVRMSEGWGAFARFELDAFGFLSPLAGKNSFLGPSFAVGMQRFVW